MASRSALGRALCPVRKCNPDGSGRLNQQSKRDRLKLQGLQACPVSAAACTAPARRQMATCVPQACELFSAVCSFLSC
jgi:hypothetical protein